MTRLGRIAFFLFVFLVAAEGVARLKVKFIPLEANQAYGKDRVVDPSSFSFFNGLGARGELWRKDRLQIALFGSSIAEQRLIPRDLTWPEKLIQRLDWNAQVDNFGKGWSQPSSVKKIADFVCGKKKYDLVFVHLLLSGYPNRRHLPFSMHYNGPQHMPELGTFLIMEHFKKFLESNVSPGISKAIPTEFWSINSDGSTGESSAQSDFIFTYDREFRATSEFLENSFYDERGGEDVWPVSKQILGMVDSLRKCSDRVIWMPELVAYHPNMSKKLNDLWVTVIGRRDERTGRMRYRNEKVIFETFLRRAEANRHVYALAGVEELNYYNALLELIPSDDDLFFSEYYMNENGAERVAEIVEYEMKRRPWFLDLDSKGKINKTGGIIPAKNQR